MWQKLMPLLLIPGFAVCGGLVHFTEARLEPVRARFSTQEIEAAKESIALTLMGQVQFTAQSLIWMKTLEYLHNGVALRMPTPAEEQRGFHAREASDVATGLGHKDGLPVALNDELDWRGPVGELHRTVMPHMDHIKHSDPTELIPWYELTLKLNPNLERLYSLGAFFMADFAGEPANAVRLLEAGAEANPWSFEVRGGLGRLLFDYHERLGIPPRDAYERAAHVLREAVSLGKEEKARLAKNGQQFDDYQDQLFRESYLFLAKSLTELGEYQEAIAVCEEGFAATGHTHLKVQERITKKRMTEDAR